MHEADGGHPYDEGVTYGLRDNFELMRVTGIGDVAQVRILDGGARSKTWQQILADVLQTDIATINTTEGAAFRAALLASAGIGQLVSVKEAISGEIKVTGYAKSGLDKENYNRFYPL